MKKILSNIFVLGCLAVALGSCTKEQFLTFDGVKSGIYIQKVAYTTIDGTPTQYTDSVTFSFTQLKAEDTEYKVNVPVCIMGDTTAFDRPFVLKVDEGAGNTQRGVHFDFSDSDCVIPAGKAKVNVPVIVKKTDDLGGGEYFRIVLKLADNEHFTVELKEYKDAAAWNATGNQISGESYKIIYSDIYSSTNTWEWNVKTALGEWSASKEKRVNAIMGWTHYDWVLGVPPYGRLGYAAKMLR